MNKFEQSASAPQEEEAPKKEKTSEASQIKKSSFKRKMLAGALGVASAIGVGGAAESTQAQGLKKAESQHVEVLKYESPDRALDAFVGITTAHLEHADFSEITATLPGVIAELEKRSEFVNMLSQNKDMEKLEENLAIKRSGEDVVEEKISLPKDLQGASRALLGAVDHAIQAADIRMLKALLPETIQRLEKELQTAQELEKRSDKR